MFRKLVILSLFSILATAGAMASDTMADDPSIYPAQSPSPSPSPTVSSIPRDDAHFYCRFEGWNKSAEVCHAFGRFDTTVPPDRSPLPGDRDDFMRIVCQDPKGSGKHVIYDGPLSVQLIGHPHGPFIDTRFAAEVIGPTRFIDVERLNWATLRGVYDASLHFGVLPYPLTRLPGRCEFRR